MRFLCFTFGKKIFSYSERRLCHMEAPADAPKPSPQEKKQRLTERLKEEMSKQDGLRDMIQEVLSTTGAVRVGQMKRVQEKFKQFLNPQDPNDKELLDIVNSGTATEEDTLNLLLSAADKMRSNLQASAVNAVANNYGTEPDPKDVVYAQRLLPKLAAKGVDPESLPPGSVEVVLDDGFIQKFVTMTKLPDGRWTVVGRMKIPVMPDPRFTEEAMAQKRAQEDAAIRNAHEVLRNPRSWGPVSDYERDRALNPDKYSDNMAVRLAALGLTPESIKSDNLRRAEAYVQRQGQFMRYGRDPNAKSRGRKEFVATINGERYFQDRDAFNTRPERVDPSYSEGMAALQQFNQQRQQNAGRRSARNVLPGLQAYNNASVTGATLNSVEFTLDDFINEIGKETRIDLPGAGRNNFIRIKDPREWFGKGGAGIGIFAGVAEEQRATRAGIRIVPNQDVTDGRIRSFKIEFTRAGTYFVNGKRIVVPDSPSATV